MSRTVSPHYWERHPPRYSELAEVLTEREAQIVAYRWGLAPTHTQKETGQLLGVSSSRIHQIESWALDKLRRDRKARGLHGYWQDIEMLRCEDLMSERAMLSSPDA